MDTMLPWVIIGLLVGAAVVASGPGLVVDRIRRTRRVPYVLRNDGAKERDAATVRYYRDVTDSSNM
jgi:hypothetical protein